MGRQSPTVEPAESRHSYPVTFKQFQCFALEPVLETVGEDARDCRVAISQPDA